MTVSTVHGRWIRTESEQGVMNKTDLIRYWKLQLRTTIPRLLGFYILIPLVLLKLLAKPIGDAVLRSDAACFRILLAALAAVGLNWYVYYLIRKKRPSLLVFAFGALFLLIVTAIEHETFESTYYLRSTLAVIGGFLLVAFLFLFSFWCAGRRNKFAHSTAVVIWVILFLLLVIMAYEAAKDIENELVTVDTWITIVSLVIFILAAFIPLFLSSHRRKASRNRKIGLTEGKIVQIIGETELDNEDRLVTRNHCRVEYAVDNVPYETKAAISRFTTRWYGRKNFIGLKVPVYYDPDNPADTYVKKIDKHIFDQLVNSPDPGGAGSGDLRSPRP